jgi:hypothetical protein
MCVASLSTELLTALARYTSLPAQSTIPGCPSHLALLNCLRLWFAHLKVLGNEHIVHYAARRRGAARGQRSQHRRRKL